MKPRILILHDMRKNVVEFILPAVVALAVLAQPVLAQQAGPSTPPKQAGKSPLKVLILAGQSNMEGYGAIAGLDKDGNERKGTLTYQLRDPAKAAMFKHLRDERPAPVPETVAIEATNDKFGDPAPNKRKKLKVEYTLEGGTQERTVDEGETLTLAAKPGQVVIRKAIYGDFPEGARSDVTETVRKIANSRQGSCVPTRSCCSGWSVLTPFWMLKIAYVFPSPSARRNGSGFVPPSFENSPLVNPVQSTWKLTQRAARPAR